MLKIRMSYSDVGDLKCLATFGCWWQNKDLGDVVLMSKQMLVTLNLSSTYLISNTCHQHHYSPHWLLGLERLQFRWLKIKGIDVIFLISITLFSNHLNLRFLNKTRLIDSIQSVTLICDFKLIIFLPECSKWFLL